MSREVLDSGSSDTDWDEPGVVPPRMSVLSRRWRGSLVLVLAFLLGATVGGIGWDTWRDRQDIAAASSAVDLTARLRNVPTLTGNDTLVQAFVLIENDGPRTVRIERISIVGPGYVPPFDDSVAPFGVESEQAVTQRIEFDIACDDSPHVGAEVRLQVQTADGVSHLVALPLADEQQYLWQLRPAVCRPEGGSLIVGVKGSSEGVIVDGAEPTLRLPVWLESLRDQTIVIASIAPTAEQLAITPEGLPVEIEGGRGEQATLIWRVIDCTGAVELDFNDLGVLVTGRVTGPEIQTAVTVDPDVALDVVAFVAATCRAA